MKMNKDTFKMIHSDLIQQVQCIEFDLRRIYAVMCEGKFEDNYRALENCSLGKITKELKKLDYSDDFPELSEEDYKMINDIRVIRNYWCHQCYLDFVYINNDRQREREFQKIAKRLQQDVQRTYYLSEKTEKLYLYILNKFR